MHSRREGILDHSHGDAGNNGSANWLVDGGLPIPTKWTPLRWLKHIFWPASSSDPSKPLRPTAYLDGLRGFAAFLVYVQHHELWAHGLGNLQQAFAMENAFGWRGEFYFATFIG